METNDNVFRFQLDESLFFRKEQEVKEMLGISLDPDITVQSYSDYVSIRGVIELFGEYEMTSYGAEEDLDDEENHAYRYLDRIEPTVENRAEFYHRFPVEISVPAYRVPNIDDIFVQISSFDYELPDKNLLNLKAIVDIYGIDQEKSHDLTASEAVEPIKERTFSFDVNLDDVKEDNEKKEKSAHLFEDETQVPSIDDHQNEYEAVQGDHLTAEQPQFPAFNEDHEPSPGEVDHRGFEYEETEILDRQEATEIEIKESEDDSASDDDDVTDVQYLADLFGDSDEREFEYVKMRICIVQEGDTLETIAERYEVPKLQILKNNRLEDDAITEGQLLSIPIKQKNK